MIENIRLFLDFSGTICVIIAAILFASKKVSNPKIRNLAFKFFLVSNSLWIPMTIITGLYFMLISQILLTIININGFMNVRKELKAIGS